MNVLELLRDRFQVALAAIGATAVEPLLDMIRPAQDARFGDFQANCAMPLGKQLQRPPREVAAELVDALEVEDFCHAPEIAGPGFINLKLREDWLSRQLLVCLGEPRLGVSSAQPPRTFVIDYSSPNVAKPMHVGHIRSTVIGDALCRTLRFLGHRVISDNHLGDWGTQFGMIIYGYKHFVDESAFADQPVSELGRLYRLVNRLITAEKATASLAPLEQRLEESRAALAAAEQQTPDPAQTKQAAKAVKRARAQVDGVQRALREARQICERVQADDTLTRYTAEHPQLGERVLQETARLHQGDQENLALWQQFLPFCRQDIQRIYDRLGVQFDHEYGESFYHDRLQPVVEQLQQAGLARESDGAICVFLDAFDAPMIVQKRDGAFLYATTDLATIAFRMQQWQPDVILYVVDFRQGEHFEKLIAAARLMGYTGVDLRHVSFGTVLGEDGRPIRTRDGELIELEWLMDEAVRHALEVVAQNDDAKPTGRELSDEERQHVAQVIGIAALKYSDLSHNRTSDYRFSFKKMVALEGNTATYLQYSYARSKNILAKGGSDAQTMLQATGNIVLEHALERDLGLQLLRFEQALQETVQDYYPNQLTDYLYELATRFHRFYAECHVLTAEPAALRASRLRLCELTRLTLKLGLELLGIDVVDRM